MEEEWTGMWASIDTDLLQDRPVWHPTGQAKVASCVWAVFRTTILV